MVTGALRPGFSGTSNSDPVIGVWKLNWDKSHVHGSYSPQIIRKYERVNGGLRISESQTDENGRQSYVEYLINYDGKEYPIFESHGPGSPLRKTNATMSFTRLDPYRVRGISRVNGKTIYTFTRIVSKDRGSLRVERVDLNPFREAVLVYDKLEGDVKQAALRR